MGHTPGPWTIEYETEGGEPYDDGVRIDSPEGPVAFNVIDCSAPLIAAAPELLAVLKDAKAALIDLYEEAYPDDESDNDTTAVIDKVIAAIAKAEGRDE